jgi:hypothetical protein
VNNHILQVIDEELARLMQARAILSESQAAQGTAPVTSKPRRNLSPEARRAIADAQRRRWARVHSLKEPAAD